MSRALVIGSYAAKLRGILPAWRRGVTRDIDLVADRATAQALASAWNTRMHEHAPDRCYLSGRIDIDLRSHLIDLVDAWCEPVHASINGTAISLLLPSPALIVAIRRATWEIVPQAQAKALADIEAFSGIDVDPVLMRFAAAFRMPGS